MSENELAYIKIKEKQKILKEKGALHVKQEKAFEEHFYDVITKLDRNLAIVNAYFDGHTQASIASYLNVSKSLISKIIKMEG
ncbi:hypothetical protein [Sulfurimonas sp. HSL3-2]|uniref:hypothetical protein n=1 Tax=Hydrocurvibacter mobilis TaxID=3131936 RepID=UPI0031F8C2A2